MLAKNLLGEFEGVGTPGLWEGWSGSWGGGTEGAGAGAEDAFVAQAGGAQRGQHLNEQSCLGRGTLGK